MTREEIEKRIDDLALNHAARHDQDVKAELEKLRKQVAKMEERHVRIRPTWPPLLRKA